MTITATDLFCGAGGSSLGAEAAGVELRMAANHWPKAIEVHQANFPDAGHDCADISQVDPRRYPRTDILLASPECTNHSSAKGVSRKRQDPTLFDSPDLAAERSRATMWDVHRFVEHHRYDAVVVENVVDAAGWIYWRSWWQAWSDAGYDARVLSINSAHTGAVHQWRDRIYVVAVRRGLSVDLEVRPPSWCPACERVVAGRQCFKRPDRIVGRWRQQYVYRCPDCAGLVDPPAPPAHDIIDWSIEGTRIGDRVRPLAAATRRRIERGLSKYGHHLMQPAHQGSDASRVRPLDAPHPTVTASRDHLALVVANNAHNVPHHVDDPLTTVTTGGRHALVVPFRRNGHTHPDDQPVGTVTAGGHHHGLLMAPQSGGEIRPDTRPTPTVVAKAGPLLVTYNRTGDARPTTEPASTVTTHDRHAVVEPAVDIDDCLFRMLEPHESGRAMAFPDTYLVEGTKTDRQRLYGNAVTPPVMQLLAARLAEALR